MSERSANTPAATRPSAERLHALFAPDGIAVIGASRGTTKLGAVMTRSLECFPGHVVGVNPVDPDPGQNRFASVAAAVAATGRAIDLAVLCVPASRSAGALTEAATAGVRAALVCSGGYAEAGGAGIGYQADLIAAANAGGVALLGPNTSGFLAPARELTASFVPGAASVPAGPVAIVAASGGVNHALAFLLADRGLGVSLAVGLGNAVDVSDADVLDYLAHDEATRAVALHIESVSNGPALASALRRLTALKPVVALVVGRTDVADFAASHTGALATSWRTTRAALRHAGAVLVEDERQLVDAVTALSAFRLTASPAAGVGVVTAQAGPGLLHVDGLRGRAVDVPPLGTATQQALTHLLPPLTYQANPVDTGRPGDSFTAVLQAVASDAVVDLLSVYALSEPDALDLAAAVEQSDVARVVVGLGGPAHQVDPQRDALRKIGVPALPSPAALTAAVVALVEDARLQYLAQQRDDPSARTNLPVLTAAKDFDEDAAKTVLQSIAVRTPPRRVCATDAQAHAALEELPLPVAVKILDAEVTHKSDIGGVHLDVRNATELDAALSALRAIGARRFLVESMARSGVDLLVGATRDPVFGPVVLVGLGGVVAEALADVAVSPAPLSATEASALLDELTARALLDGFRGGPVVDRTAVGAVIAALGDLLVANDALEAVEINPLRTTNRGLLALDAVITRRAPSLFEEAQTT